MFDKTQRALNWALQQRKRQNVCGFNNMVLHNFMTCRNYDFFYGSYKFYVTSSDSEGLVIEDLDGQNESSEQDLKIT